MASINHAGPKRFRMPWDETHELREALFARLRHRKRYRNIVDAQLRPLWLKARADREDNRLFVELKAAAADPAARAVREYVEEVDSILKRPLRLTHEAQPCIWAGNWLHADVEPRSGQGAPWSGVSHPSRNPNLERVWFEHSALHLRVGPDQAVLALIDDDGSLVREQVIPGAAGYGDREWAAIKAQALALIEAHLPEMRARYEAMNQPTGKARQAVRQRAQIDDMELLACWLLAESVPDKRDRDRLRNRLSLLGLDTPSMSALPPL